MKPAAGPAGKVQRLAQLERDVVDRGGRIGTSFVHNVIAGYAATFDVGDESRSVEVRAIADVPHELGDIPISSGFTAHRYG
jgi:hypothetical protein